MKFEKLPVNSVNQQPMMAYMKNKFPFLGLKAPQRKDLTKELIRQSRDLSEADLLKLIDTYYQADEREYQYVAIDLGIANVKRLSFTSVLALVPYVSMKSWWDSVDAWRKFFGLRIRHYPEELVKIFNVFYQSNDFWQRRVGINLQLLQREQTDLILLEKAILQDRQTDEFFIQKAIGWSLREYSKTDATWVKTFFQRHQLSPLAVREGSKHLK